jgi:hypothetical protein
MSVYIQQALREGTGIVGIDVNYRVAVGVSREWRLPKRRDTEHAEKECEREATKHERPA